MKKTVSVVMCTYNGAKYLREQLDSIISQTYPIYELIIQDDCSSDETMAIVQEYAKDHPIIKLFVNESNLGYNRNFKSALMKATGDYIAISDQDDVWFPEKIKTQIDNIGDHSICCSFFLFGTKLETASVIEKEIGAERVLFGGIIHGHSMLCRRDFIQNDDIWQLSVWYDWRLSINAYLEKGITIVRKPLNWHRHHEGEITYTKKTSFKPYQPYLYGYRSFRERQKTPAWNSIYPYIFSKTNNEKLPIVHIISGLLLKKDFFSFLRLCFVCLKHRDVIYPQKEIGKGVMPYVRGFCYPLIWSYFNNAYFRTFE